jgi:hypothetical protein
LDPLTDWWTHPYEEVTDWRSEQCDGGVDMGESTYVPLAQVCRQLHRICIPLLYESVSITAVSDNDYEPNAQSSMYDRRSTDRRRMFAKTQKRYAAVKERGSLVKYLHICFPWRGMERVVISAVYKTSQAYSGLAPTSKYCRSAVVTPIQSRGKSLPQSPCIYLIRHAT